MECVAESSRWEAISLWLQVNAMKGQLDALRQEWLQLTTAQHGGYLQASAAVRLDEVQLESAMLQRKIESEVEP